jgi:hypothetical protein
MRHILSSKIANVSDLAAGSPSFAIASGVDWKSRR